MLAGREKKGVSNGAYSFAKPAPCPLTNPTHRIGDEAIFVLVDFSENDVKQAVELTLKKWAKEKVDVVNLHWTPNAVMTLADECIKVCPQPPPPNPLSDYVRSVSFVVLPRPVRSALGG